MRRMSRAGQPRRVSGCFSSAIIAAGAKFCANASMARSRKAPGTVLTNGRPAESSTRMPQLSSRIATRRASSRSGETSAAVRPGLLGGMAHDQGDRFGFVLGGRRGEAMDAGERGCGLSSASMVSPRRCQWCVVVAGRIASLIRRAGAVCSGAMPWRRVEA